MAKRITLRKEQHGDITVFVDRFGWKRGFVYPEEGRYAFCGPIGRPAPMTEEMGFGSKRAAEAALRKIIREGW